ncbi:prenyltransferase/squalene oxidase repeat-containing protein [Paludisphaera rhizosphaerae]|uniref:prenyltransferase/squalene oxidase repeat-containing protein n=1 Tax=Paludisphaera rhizosphaerae TaxID=2711216 RepID=UPI0013EBE62A|nr:prenyltransferase/squalene oxidase repeat-containing protein [Paludisphaera rhizosphaerae]
MSLPSRRDLFRTAGAGLTAGWLGQARAEEAYDAVGDRIAAYLETLRRPDGGYAASLLAPRSHLTPTFAAIGCLHLLKRLPTDRSTLARYVRDHHPHRLKKLEQEHHEFEGQQIQALIWLGEAPADFRQVVDGWKPPSRYLPQYERSSNPILRHETVALEGRRLLGMPLDDVAPVFLEYLRARRRPEGGYNNTPASDGGPAHVLNTWWALRTLDALGQARGEGAAETIAWLRLCQLPNGGFTHAPNATLAGVDDAAYTWAAVRGLTLLGSQPADRDGCVRWIASLFNEDGGAGDRPGWASRPEATFYALDALEAVGRPAVTTARRSPGTRSSDLPGGLNVYSIQIEAHGQGSPADAVTLAESLKIHLWGAKNAAKGWVERAQSIADGRKVATRFFVANEEYGSWLRMPGLGVYSHMSDVIAPAGVDFGPPIASGESPDWAAFRERRLEPLQKAGGRLVWQFGENEELVRLVLDDSLERGGYAAISTFHFGNPDFTNSEPFLERYRGRLPFVALQDAHGPQPWYFADMTTGFRTLFLASEPTWAAWLEALRLNRVAAVRRDEASGGQTWIQAGSSAVLEFVRAHESDWRWWENPSIRRPMLSLVAVFPGDPFETPQPERGVVVRVRTAWTNSTQGRPRTPLAVLDRLRIDGRDVEPAESLPKPPNGAGPLDQFYYFSMPDIAPGRHKAEARARVIGSGELVDSSITFDVPAR